MSSTAATMVVALVRSQDASAVLISPPSDTIVDVQVLSDASMPAWPVRLALPDEEDEADPLLEPLPPAELIAEWLGPAAPELVHGVDLAEEDEPALCDPDEALCVAEAETAEPPLPVPLPLPEE